MREMTHFPALLSSIYFLHDGNYVGLTSTQYIVVRVQNSTIGMFIYIYIGNRRNSQTRDVIYLIAKTAYKDNDVD